MPSLPRDPLDRLASAEQRLAVAESQLEATRRRNAEHTTPRELFPARTIERTTTSTTTTSGGETSSTSSTTTTTGYPPCCDVVQLPIVTQGLAIVDDELIETDRWTQQLSLGLSRIGWLPPDLDVWVVHDRERFVIVGAPEHLHGVACCEIPAAVRTDDHEWELSCGQVAVFRKTGDQYEPQRYADGTPVLMDWCNAHPDAAVPAGPLLTAHQNAESVWVIDQVVTAWTTTSTTTTTPLANYSECSGDCKWVWSAASEEWTLDTDGCATSTSSTTTTSEGATTVTSSSTTTTTDLCGCPTSSTSSTTTTTPGCDCLYPTFCGTADEQCTYTQCAPYVNQPPVCASTTTTTCDCDTSTTTTTGLPEGCDGSCYWVGVPGFILPGQGGGGGVVGTGAWVWRLMGGGCPGSCPCPQPTSDPYCNTDTTYCVYTPTPPVTPEPWSCEGTCIWWWVPALSAWVLETDGCSNSVNCDCQPPSQPGTSCSPIGTPCVPTVATTTTTEGPCAHCYTSSTTTTTGVCDGYCLWQWDTDAWELLVDECPSACPCLEPPFGGQDDCDVEETPCAGSTTTTTTTSTTTTTTTTTTTSTTTTTPNSVCCCPDAYDGVGYCTEGIFDAERCEETCTILGSGVYYFTAQGGSCVEVYGCSAGLVCCGPTTTTGSSTSTTTMTSGEP